MATRTARTVARSRMYTAMLVWSLEQPVSMREGPASRPATSDLQDAVLNKEIMFKICKKPITVVGIIYIFVCFQT